jgi:AcrR family transcriptional regulator
VHLEYTPEWLPGRAVPVTITRISELFGQPAPPSTGRERLIAAGLELFYHHGFQTVGIDRVIEHAGVTKTTFYKHFEGKDDFVIACLRSRDDWEMGAWARAVSTLAGEDPRAQLLAYFEVLDVWFNDPAFRGCMFISAASEFSDRRDPVHIAAAEHKRKTRDQFRLLAARAGASDPDAFADEYTILMEGTLVVRHVHGRDDAARVAKPAVVALIGRHMPIG